MWGHIYTSLWIGELEKVLLSAGVPVHFTPNNSTQTKNMKILYQCLVKVDLINAYVASDLQKHVRKGTYWTYFIERLGVAGISIQGHPYQLI